MFTRDITTEVAWRVKNRKIATVINTSGSQGLVSAESPGQTVVNASLEGITGSAAVIVSNAELSTIEITPKDAELNIGLTQQYTATGLFSDDSEQDISLLVSWTSSDTGVATINAGGLATAQDNGTIRISAAWQGVEGDTDLTVSAATLTAIEVIPDQATIARETTIQFEAEGTYSDDTTFDITSDVDWLSSDETIAVISDTGLATGVTQGAAEITASFTEDGEKTTGSAEITVTDAVIESITVTPENSTIEVGKNQQFTATGFFSDDSEQDITELATWLTQDNSVGTISNTPGSRGLFAGTDSGSTIITAAFGDVNGDTLLTVE
jgi:hypothetical protein